MKSLEWAGLILAAGKGSRFQAETGEAFPKVLRPVLGRPMVRYVMDTLERAGVSDITLVVGFRAEDVEREIGSAAGYVCQPVQKGSGHAVACAKERFEGFDGGVVVMCGDSPLFESETVRELLRMHEENGATITLASAILDNPFGYGRIVRDECGRITGIVEEKCASAEERAIREVNGGVYAFDGGWLFTSIDRMAINDAGEYNLTDMVRVAVEEGKTVSAVKCDPMELLGVNTPDQLAVVESILRGKQG
jgi:bifunctional UDP-N-acetylglucosamine pyrophosphorylase/glucosamine-1-phosphate N-acetyltransferase